MRLLVIMIVAVSLSGCWSELGSDDEPTAPQDAAQTPDPNWDPNECANPKYECTGVYGGTISTPTWWKDCKNKVCVKGSLCTKRKHHGE